MKKKLYRLLGAITMYIAVLSVIEVRHMCTIMIYQPDVPDQLKEKIKFM